MRNPISAEVMIGVADDLDRLNAENAALRDELASSHAVSKDLADRVTYISQELFKTLDALRVERHVDRRRMAEVEEHVDRISNLLTPLLLEASLKQADPDAVADQHAFHTEGRET